jgi:hypothetical protein
MDQIDQARLHQLCFGERSDDTHQRLVLEHDGALRDCVDVPAEAQPPAELRTESAHFGEMSRLIGFEAQRFEKIEQLLETRGLVS